MKYSSPFFALGALALISTLAPDQSAKAQMLTVPNFSFETPALGNNGNATFPQAGWVGAGGQATGIENPSGKFTGDNTGAGTLPAPADGVNAAFINTGGGTATITSAASIGTVSLGTPYTLTVAVGNALGGGTQLPGNFTIALLVNGTAATTFTSTDGNTITDGAFASFTTSFTATGAQDGGALTVQLTEIGNNGTNQQIFFDNVNVSAVPEPGTWAATVCGLGLLLVAKRRYAQS